MKRVKIFSKITRLYKNNYNINNLNLTNLYNNYSKYYIKYNLNYKTV